MTTPHSNINPYVEYPVCLLIAFGLWAFPLPGLTERQTFVFKLLVPTSLGVWVWGRGWATLKDLEQLQLRDAKRLQEQAEAAAQQQELANQSTQLQSKAAELEQRALNNIKEQEELARQKIQAEQEASRQQLEEERKQAEAELQEQWLQIQAQYQQVQLAAQQLEAQKAELARQPTPEEIEAAAIQEHFRTMEMGLKMGTKEEEVNTALELKRLEHEAALLRKRRELGLIEDDKSVASSTQTDKLLAQLLAAVERQQQLPQASQPAVTIDTISVPYKEPVSASAGKRTAFTPDPPITFDRQTQESSDDFPEFEIT